MKTKLTKQNFIDNGYNIFLCFLYSGILALVYFTWIYKKSNLVWLAILFAVVFIACGIVFATLSTLKKKTIENEKKE